MSIYVDDLLDEIRAPKKKFGSFFILITLVSSMAIGAWLFVEPKLSLNDNELGVLSKTAANLISKESGQRVSTLDVWNEMVSRTGKKSSRNFSTIDRIESAQYLIKLIENNSRFSEDQLSGL
jgi:hypothetical protein